MQRSAVRFRYGPPISFYIDGIFVALYTEDMDIKIIVWVALSIAVGFLWKKLKLSLVSGVIWSLVLSPIVGVVIGFVWSSIRNRNNGVKTDTNLQS